MNNNLGHLSPTIEHLARHWETQRRAAAERDDVTPGVPHAFTVTISREAGTSSNLVAQEVGRRLGWQVYDDELLERIADEMHVRTALLKSVDERHQSWLLESIEAFGAAPESDATVTEEAYVRHLVETVLALGAHGECLIVGRGAAFILPASTTLRVRLVAPVKSRVSVFRRKLGIPDAEAARRIKTIDRERNNFVRNHFLRDPADPRHYDLLLNAGRLPIAVEAEVIIKTLRQLQAAAREKAEAVYS
jgi:cytidylate kinase